MIRKNKVTFGLSNVHVAFMSDEGYETPIHIPGATNFTPSTRGDNVAFSADNTSTYFEKNVNNGYSADLGLANIPDDVLARMLGWEIDENGGLVELVDGKPEKFALGFQVEGDANGRKTWHYDVLANRPAREEQTSGDTSTITADQLNVSISPVTIEGKKMVKYTLEETEENKVTFDAFFDEVTKPNFKDDEGA